MNIGEMPDNTPGASQEVRDRFLLIRHDNTGRNLAHLFDYASVVAGVVVPAHGNVPEEVGIDVVCVSHACQSDAQIEYLATHQLRTLDRGMEARSRKVFKTLADAQVEAGRVAKAIAVRYRDTGVR